MLIKISEKGWFKAFGLHHALIVFCYFALCGILATVLNHGFLIGSGLVFGGQYVYKEIKERGWRAMKGFELFDCLSPCVAVLIAWWVLW